MCRQDSDIKIRDNTIQKDCIGKTQYCLWEKLFLCYFTMGPYHWASLVGERLVSPPSQSLLEQTLSPEAYKVKVSYKDFSMIRECRTIYQDFAGIIGLHIRRKKLSYAILPRELSGGLLDWREKCGLMSPPPILVPSRTTAKSPGIESKGLFVRLPDFSDQISHLTRHPQEAGQ